MGLVMPTLHPFRLLLPALLLTALAGCGGSNTYPVEGKIIFTDGKDVRQLEGGTVEFMPVEEGKESAIGDIQADGSFRLTTGTAGAGAAPGKYRVIIALPQARSVDLPPPPVIHPRYEDPATTDLEVVVETKKNEVVLKVDRAPRK
jgi:hypothetical protein